jgi:hypothetical protein
MALEKMNFLYPELNAPISPPPQNGAYIFQLFSRQPAAGQNVPDIGHLVALTGYPAERNLHELLLFKIIFPRVSTTTPKSARRTLLSTCFS